MSINKWSNLSLPSLKSYLSEVGAARQGFAYSLVHEWQSRIRMEQSVDSSAATAKWSVYCEETHVRQVWLGTFFSGKLRILSNLPKTPKKGIPKVNCMLFLDHLDDMHGVGLLWKVTLWGLFLNSRNHCKSYWYWVIALWTHWKI